MNAGAMQKSSVSLSTNPDGTVYCWIAGGTGLDSRVRPRNALKGSAVGNRLIRHWCPGAVAASTGTLVSKDFQLPLRDSKLCVTAVEAH